MHIPSPPASVLPAAKSVKTVVNVYCVMNMCHTTANFNVSSAMVTCTFNKSPGSPSPTSCSCMYGLKQTIVMWLQRTRWQLTRDLHCLTSKFVMIPCIGSSYIITHIAKRKQLVLFWKIEITEIKRNGHVEIFQRHRLHDYSTKPFT